MTLKTKYYYFFQGTLATHVHFYEAWVNAARGQGLSLEMVTVLSLFTWYKQRLLVKKYGSFDYFHILFSVGGWVSIVVACLFFLRALLRYDRVVVQLKKQPPELFDLLKKLFPSKLRYIIELEGDPESESEYLLEHPYKPGFYDDVVKRAKRQAAMLEQRIQKCDHVLVLSPYLKQLLIERFPGLGLESKISVISTGVDCDQRFFSRTLRYETRKALDLKDKFVMIFIGNAYYSWQSVFRTIEVFRVVKDRLASNAFLILLIRKQDHSIVQEFVADLDLASDDYLLRCVPPEEVTRYLNAADLGIIFRHEHLMNRVASPGKFGDYLACGLPVLMTKGISNYSEMIDQTGYAIVLEDMDDDDEVLRGAKTFLEYSIEQREEIYNWARKNVSVKAHADKYVEALRKAASAD